MSEKIAVVGLGYVGLPVALAFAKQFPTIGFDINEKKVALLREGMDRTGEVTAEELQKTTLKITSDTHDLSEATFYVVAVPTGIDKNHNPDLKPLLGASETIGKAIRPGAVVVFESTVYPGITEEICGKAIEKISGLKAGVDFHLGYSPERINPGDKEHTLERIVKVVAGDDADTLERVANVYAAIVPAGVHRASSIKVAEAAKVIENTQRDLNIALMNELALIFDRIGIRTHDVLEAACTKWNFLPFRPGLVGGHCIGVDPYYLTTKAEELGYHPQIILAGRRINDGMGQYLAQRMIKLLSHNGIPVKHAKIGILGLTFKEDVPDLRNSRVPDIVAELREFGIDPLVHDPVADADEAHEEYALKLCADTDLCDLDGVVIAVAHEAYRNASVEKLLACLKPGGVVVDVKSMLTPDTLPDGVRYWSL